MTYIRKYEFVHSATLTKIYTIVIWMKPFEVKKKTKTGTDVIEYLGHWAYIHQLTYISRQERDTAFDDLIQDGIIYAGVVTTKIRESLEPPNETDIQIGERWL